MISARKLVIAPAPDIACVKNQPIWQGDLKLQTVLRYSGILSLACQPSWLYRLRIQRCLGATNESTGHESPGDVVGVNPNRVVKLSLGALRSPS